MPKETPDLVFTARKTQRRQMAQDIIQDLEGKRPSVKINKDGIAEGRSDIIIAEGNTLRMADNPLINYQLAATLKRALMTPHFLVTLKALQIGAIKNPDFFSIKDDLGLTDKEIERLLNKPTATELSRIFDDKMVRIMSVNSESQLSNEEDKELYSRLFGSFDINGEFVDGIIQAIIYYPQAYDRENNCLKLDYALDCDLMVFPTNKGFLDDFFAKLGISDKDKEIIIEEIITDDLNRITSTQKRLTRIGNRFQPGEIIDRAFLALADTMKNRALLKEKPLPKKFIVIAGKTVDNEACVDDFQSQSYDNIGKEAVLYVPSFTSAWIANNNGEVKVTGVANPAGYVFMFTNNESGHICFFGQSSGHIINNRGSLVIADHASVFVENLEDVGRSCDLTGNSCLLFLTKYPSPDRFLFHNATGGQIFVIKPPSDVGDLIKNQSSDYTFVENEGELFVIISAVSAAEKEKRQAVAVFKPIEIVKGKNHYQSLVFVDGRTIDNINDLYKLEKRLKGKTGFDFVLTQSD